MISVIIPTVDRPGAAARLVETLKGQTASDFEVIVVDQSAEPDPLLADEVIRIAERGLPNARNVGAPALILVHRFPDNLLQVQAKKSIEPHQWHHILALYDGSGKVDGVKLYVDGSGGARTAWMYEDWNKDSNDIDAGNRGYPAMDPDVLREQKTSLSLPLAQRSGLFSPRSSGMKRISP